jgi:hypothetical protein
MNVYLLVVLFDKIRVHGKMYYRISATRVPYLLTATVVEYCVWLLNITFCLNSLY